MPSSIPGGNSLTFVELQMLINKKEFLEKQLLTLENRKKQISAELKNIAENMKRIEAIVNEDSEKVKQARHKKKKYGVELTTVEYY